MYKLQGIFTALATIIFIIALDLLAGYVYNSWLTDYPLPIIVILFLLLFVLNIGFIIITSNILYSIGKKYKYWD